MRTIRLLFPALTLAAAAFCQQFEVASIKKSAPYDAMTGKNLNIGVRIDGAQVHISTFALRDYIASAYKLKLHQIAGPDWLPSERFDIDATMPPGAKRDDFPVLLQGLLADRFQMKFHMETRDLPAYVLSVWKGGFKLKPVELDAAPEGGPHPDATDVAVSGGPQGTTVTYGRGSYFSMMMSNHKVEAHKLSMARLADLLGRFVELPVVDQTAIEGLYDFDLDLTQDDFMAVMIHSAVAAGVTLPPEALQMAAGNNPDSLYAALHSLGLNLEKKKAPIQVLVVDSILRTPTEN